MDRTIVIIGLGNPWESFKNTRHNFGARGLTAFATKHKFKLKRARFYHFATGSLFNKNIVLVRSNVDINRSGVLLDDWMDRIDSGESLWILHDDISLDLGRFRLKAGGGTGGHKGVASMIEKFGANDFIRLKMGIGYPEQETIWDYVFAEFYPDEIKLVEHTLELVVNALDTCLNLGIESAQNIYN